MSLKVSTPTKKFSSVNSCQTARMHLKSNVMLKCKVNHTVVQTFIFRCLLTRRKTRSLSSIQESAWAELQLLKTLEQLPNPVPKNSKTLSTKIWIKVVMQLMRLLGNLVLVSILVLLLVIMLKFLVSKKGKLVLDGWVMEKEIMSYLL